MKKSLASFLSIVAAITLLVHFASTAWADFNFGSPVQFPYPINTSSFEGSPIFSPNNLEFYLESDRYGWGTYLAKRDMPSDPFGTPVKSAGNFHHATMSSDGLALYGHDDCCLGGRDIWTIARPSLDAPWDISTLHNLGTSVNSSWWERFPGISPDEKELYFTRTTGYDLTYAEIWVAKRTDKNASFEPAIKLPANINQEFGAAPTVSPNGLALFFASERDGGYGNTDIWVSYRTDKDSPWGDPVNLGPTINSTGYEVNPSMAADGRTFLFSRSATKNSNSDLWYANVIIHGPGDYDDNGAVEQGDLDLVLLNWGGSSLPTGWLNDLPTFPIDQGELDIVRANWGSTTAAPANSTVPEPASLLLIVMGLAGLGIRRTPVE